ncbi:MAG: PAS domain S-box protein, partial [Minisyncoccota bacterium]
MFSRETFPLIAILGGLYVVVAVLSYWWAKKIKREVEEKERDLKHRLYEIAILKEISDRTGYSLNIQKILDVITGSLRQFIEYSAASYMLLEPSKIVFKADLDQSVSPQFIKDIRERMLKSLEALLGRPITDMPIEETLTGAIMLDDMNEPVKSFFNIPLVIENKLVGVLTVAHTKAGLYKEEEMAILYKIVNQASQAVTSLEEVVKTEQGKITAMLESMVEGVVMTDRDYHIVAVNPAAKAVMGYTSADLPTIFDLNEKFKGVFDIKEKLEESIKLDKVLTLDGISLGGKYYQILLSPVKSNQGPTKGQILGGVIIFHDITHEKEAEKMRNDFTSMMVHELRSPLGNITKIGELMRSSKVL